MHVNVHYPIPVATTPCYQAAAQSPTQHVLISETEFTVPGSVPDEATKATATVAEFTAFA